LNYKERIISWYNKTKEFEGDYFIQYYIEYLAFLCYIKILKFKYVQTDRKAIQKLKQNSEIKESYLERINNNKELKKDWNKIIERLDKEPLNNVFGYNEEIIKIKWWDCSDNNNPKIKDYEDDIVKDGKIHNLKDWINMVEFWYSIRCNLFHGVKDLQKERDEFLVKYGYKTLNELLKIFLDQINIKVK